MITGTKIEVEFDSLKSLKDQVIMMDMASDNFYALKDILRKLYQANETCKTVEEYKKFLSELREDIVKVIEGSYDKSTN